MANTYILTFQGVTDNKFNLKLPFSDNTSTQNTSTQNTSTQNTSTQISASSVDGNSVDVDIRLSSINIDKEMYKPCCITAEVDLVYNGTLNESIVSNIVSKLLNTTVNIGTSTESTDNIAKGYRVVNIQPRRKCNTQSLKTILTISMYSPDKYLDMKKYSKCYTAKRLGKDILEGLKKELDEVNNIPITLDYAHQQNMLYELTDNELKELKESNILTGGYVIETETTEKDGKKLTKKYLEGIQPYLVQYNETPYHFLARSANKCGEFLFYEDGKLWLGLDTSKSDAMKSTIPSSTDTADIKVFDTIQNGATKIVEGDIADVIYNEYQEEDQCDMQSWDYTLEEKEEEKKDKPKHKKHIGSGDKVQTYEGPSEEYLNGYNDEKEDKNKFTWKDKWPSNIYSILQADDIVDMGVKFGMIEGSGAAFWRMKKDYTENKYKEDFVDKYTDKQKIDFVHYDKGESKIHQFSLAKKYNASLTHDLYQRCRKCSEVVQKRTIFVKLRNNSSIILKLGYLVNIFNREYVVTKLHYEKNLSGSEINNWFEAVPVLAVVSQKTEKSTKKKIKVLNPGTGNYEDKDVPEIEKSYKPCYTPALLAANQKRTAAPQRAYVISTKDPLSLGRIRILYPWQPNDKNDKNKNDEYSSPFIRVAQPFASKDGGIRFTPQEGDEVMIGYEFDDIERPFVIGAVSSMDNNGSKVSGNNDMICSPNGHKIQFSNPKNCLDFINGISPAFAAVQKFIPSEIAKDWDKAKELAGGIKLTDKFGVYNLDLSTDKRKITIQSPLGSIQMDAFTGITINCPNGDISLKGKNITIEAGDKLSLASGKNIDKQKIHPLGKFLLDKANNLFTTTLSSFGAEDIIKLNLADMKTLRAVMDAILKPINGTMSIRSGRFMQIEAGKGKTKLPNLYKEGSRMYKMHEEQSNSVWMRFLTILDTWYDNKPRTEINSKPIIDELKTHFDGVREVKIANATMNQDEYNREMESLYKNVTKNTPNEIQEHIDGVVRDKFDTVTVQKVVGFAYRKLSEGQITTIQNKIKEYLTAKLRQSQSKAELNNFLVTNTTNIDDKNSYNAIVNQAYSNSQTKSDHNKRYFFYEIINELKVKGKLNFYKRNSYSKFVPFTGISTKETVCENDDEWDKFVGIVGPDRGIWLNSIGFEYVEFLGAIKNCFSTFGLWKSDVTGGAILMADSNTNGHTVTFNMGDTTNNVMGPAQTIEPVNLKAVADGATTTAKNILKNIK